MLFRFDLLSITKTTFGFKSGGPLMSTCFISFYPPYLAQQTDFLYRSLSPSTESLLLLWQREKKFQSKCCEGIRIAVVNTTEDTVCDPISAATSMTYFNKIITRILFLCQSSSTFPSLKCKMQRCKNVRM